MLSLLAVFVLTPVRILPQPFLSTSLEPLLPIEQLRGQPRYAVTRAGSWRPGGYVRVNYYYFYPNRDAPKLEEMESSGGFAKEMVAAGANSPPRIARVQRGIRQVVWVRDIAASETWRWANIRGPGQVVGVSDIPIEETPSIPWHPVASLNKPCIPPGFPGHWPELATWPLISVETDALIPRFFRSSYWIVLQVGSPLEVDQTYQQAKKKVKGNSWKAVMSNGAQSIMRTRQTYGLTNVEIRKGSLHRYPNVKSVVTLTYMFRDFENSPRILD